MGTSASMSLTTDELIELLEIHDLHVAPIESLGDELRRQHHPEVAARKYELENGFVAELEALDHAEPWQLPDRAVDAMYAVAGLDLLPEVYDWLVERATYDELVEFLTLEGGPDADFDDLVARCQVGL